MYEKGIEPINKFYLNRANAIKEGINYYIDAFEGTEENPYDKEKETKKWLKSLDKEIKLGNKDTKTVLELGMDGVYFNIYPVKFEDE
jgi:hypothetical protein